MCELLLGVVEKQRTTKPFIAVVSCDKAVTRHRTPRRGVLLSSAVTDQLPMTKVYSSMMPGEPSAAMPVS